MTTRQDVVDALVAERYGPPLWWKAPELRFDDNELAQALRRRLMAEDFDTAGAPAEATS